MPPSRKAPSVLGGTWLELEVIQTHMTQKPLLWVEMGAHVVHKQS
jgi:hypothetical protein